MSAAMVRDAILAREEAGSNRTVWKPIQVQVNKIPHTCKLFVIKIVTRSYNYLLRIIISHLKLYGCTTWTLTKHIKKKFDGNYTRMLRALNSSWRLHPTKQQLYGHRPPITKTIELRRTRHAGHCWRSRDELVSDILLWTPSHGRAKVGRPARTYMQPLCADTGCSLDRDRWWERVRDICAGNATLWWWWIETVFVY